jgi:Fe-S-cluster containining protein
MAKKFLGKIRSDPWEALARGPREVMASLWREYLEEVLEADPKSARVRLLRQEIEEAGGFGQIYRDWPGLSPEARAESWYRLVAVARERVPASRESCVRCGECCERSSPTLLIPDLTLLQDEVLGWDEVYTLRAGEQESDRQGTVTTLKEERLKVREVPGSRQCWFYLAARRTCRIYERRPEQCRRQQCWGEPAPPPKAGELLTRRHLFAAVPEVWDLISAHQERCDPEKVAQALAELAAGQEAAGDALFDALHFDHYLRQMFLDEWGLSQAATELLLGRPLTVFLRDQGYNATLGPEGACRLTPR